MFFVYNDNAPHWIYTYRHTLSLHCSLPILLVAQLARHSSGGADLTLYRDRDKNPVVALREIAEQTVKPKHIEESVVSGLQKVQVDEDDTPDEVGSLAASAEALRLTAAAPPRNTNEIGRAHV